MEDTPGSLVDNTSSPLGPIMEKPSLTEGTSHVSLKKAFRHPNGGRSGISSNIPGYISTSTLYITCFMFFSISIKLPYLPNSIMPNRLRCFCTSNPVAFTSPVGIKVGSKDFVGTSVIDTLHFPLLYAYTDVLSISMPPCAFQPFVSPAIIHCPS